jgi:hypothetical protein
MIIKSHIRGGYRAAADYLKEFGKNEKIRLVEISDPDASNLDEAFHNMWTVASNTRCRNLNQIARHLNGRATSLSEAEGLLPLPRAVLAF